MKIRLLAVLACSSLVLLGCGSEDSPPKASTSETPGQAGGTIVVTTEDGSIVEFTDFKVTCPGNVKDDWGQDGQVVQVTAGAYGTADHADKDGIVLTAGAGTTTTVTLPYGEEYGSYQTFITAFLPRAGKAEELSADLEESSGTIEIVEATCAPTPRLELNIDAELASETGTGSATVKGHLLVGGDTP